jgi:hypothetical protein
MNASGDMSKKAAGTMATAALELANEYSLDGAELDSSIKDLHKVQEWFNNYKCPKCGYDKEDRMSQII